MMTTAEYKSCRDQLLENQNPFLVLSKEEIMAEHDNIYRIGDMSIAVTPYVQDTIDKLIGFTPHQRKGLKEAFGDSAMNRFRNSLAMATCVEKPQRFALIANPQGLSVDGIVPINPNRSLGFLIAIQHWEILMTDLGLMPYSKLLDLYAEAGYDSRNFNTAQAKSNIMMWDVFNKLTDFASHSPLWQADDNRRSSLMQDSMKLLQRKRDIRPYYDIFTE